MRTATILAWGQIDWWPGNLFRGWRPCICLTLKLLSVLWLVVRDWVFTPTPPPPLPPLSLKRVRENRDTHVCVSPCDVGSYQSVRFCVRTCVLDEGLNRECRRGRECQSILTLENSRSFFHVLPAIGQPVPNQSAA